MKLSVIIPARNEIGSVAKTVTSIAAVLGQELIEHEILVVDDGSNDGTGQAVAALAIDYPQVRLIRNLGARGYGHAVRAGLQAFTGDAAAIMMADNSDSPLDLVGYYRALERGAECVFGSRFIKGGAIHDYPPHKLVLNRLANWFIAVLFGLRLNDTTNAFKCYRRNVIEGLQPLLSAHFNLTVEMPLKAIVRGYSFEIVPISWQNRAEGISKLKIREMGSRYLFIVLYVLLEKYLARGDYRRAAKVEQVEPQVASLGRI